MKMQAIFDLIQDAQDVLTFFEGVTTTDQMISRLDRLKRQAPEDFADCLDALRFSVSAALEDNLELGGPLGSDDEEADDIFASITLPDDETPSKEPSAGSTNESSEPADQQSTSPVPPVTTETK
jgi:hypothetical protein